VWSPDGTQIAYTRGDGIYLIGTDGSNKRHLVNTLVNQVSWSPDSNSLLFSGCLNESSEQDIYVVNVHTGVLTNLTHGNGGHDTHPKWTLDGTKIMFVFMSTPDPMYWQLPTNTCIPEVASDSTQLKIVDADGSNERLVYEKKGNYSFYSVSNGGEIAFVAELTEDGHSLDYLYTMNLNNPTPIIRDRALRLTSWSPDGKYLVYEGTELKVFNVDSEEIRDLPPEHLHYTSEIDTWSPNSQQVAVTTLTNINGFYYEKHVYIFNFQDGTLRPLVQRLWKQDDESSPPLP